MIKKDLSKEIKQYYNISKFVNKYFIVVFSFVLSLVGVFAFNSDDVKILEYTSSNILNDFSKSNTVGLNVNKFNKKSNEISSYLMFTRSKITKGGYQLGYGIFNVKDREVYLPSNVKLYKRFFKNIDNNIGLNYYRLLFSSDYYKKYKLKIPRLIKKTDDEIIKYYNLDCMNTLLNNTAFCNYNKKYLLSDLIEKNIDISPNIFNKLFKNLPLSKEKKCSSLIKIFNKNYNADSFLSISEQYCDYDTYIKLDIANEFIKKIILAENKIFLQKKSKYIQNTKTILANQWYKLVKLDTIPSEDLVNHINLVKELILDDLMDQETAEIEYIILKNIDEKIKLNSDYSKLKSKIKLLINGETDVFPGLKSFINNFSKLSNKNKSQIFLVKKEVKSVREVIKDIFTNKYSRVFKFTDKVKYNNESKNILVKGYLKLYFDGKSNKQYNLPILFEVYDIIGSNFKVKNVNILDNKLNNYIKNSGINLYGMSFEELISVLTDKLYAPIVNNDYGNLDNTSVCDKYNLLSVSKKYNGKCNNDTLIISSSSIFPNYKFKDSFDIILTLNSNMEVVKIKISKPYSEEMLDSISGKDKIKVNLSIMEKYVNKKLPLSITNTISLVKKLYDKLKSKGLNKKIGLSNSAISNLNEKFITYLNTKVDNVIRYKGYIYKLYFTVNGYNFMAIYDLNKNKINHLILLTGKNKKKFIFKDIDLRLSDVNKEILDAFSIEPLRFLEDLYPDVIKNYKEYINKK